MPILIESNDREEYTNELTALEIDAYTDCLEHTYWGRRHTAASNVIKGIEIVLSGITSVSFFAVIFEEGGQIAEIIGASFSLILFITAALVTNFKFAESATAHAKASNNLEKISRETKSLMTDMDDYSPKEVKSRRDGLYARYYDEKDACPLMKKLNMNAAVSVAHYVESRAKLQQTIVRARDQKYVKALRTMKMMETAPENNQQ